MAGEEYEYDVAFSFVKDDEPTATALNDLLQDRLSTFLYSKRQEDLAGTDGEQSFSEVFGEKSRIVAVIYRNTWGDTPWTRIEETAIRNRAFEEGYDFVVFIPVEEGAKLPRWLPKTQLWVGFKRWGLEGAASVIESRVQAAGGEPREETASQRAVRLKRQIQAEESRKSFLNSIEGVNAALQELETLYSTIETSCEEIKGDSGYEMRCQRTNDRRFDVCAGGFCIGIDFHYNCRNSLDGSYLKISMFNGTVPRMGRHFPFEKPQRVSESKYNFDRNWAENTGWWDPEKSQFISTQRLADHMLKILMNRIHKEQVERKRH